MSFHIRPAIPEDLTILALIAQSVWVDSYARDGVERDFCDYVQQQFQANQLLQDWPKVQYWLAEGENGIKGYLKFAPQSGEIMSLYVIAGCRGQGVGRSLIEAMPKAVPIWLSCWHKNYDALAFYRNTGFAVTGETWFELSGQRHKNFVLEYRP